MNKNRQLTHEASFASSKRFPLVFVVHDFEHPSNVGSIFRLADAFGVEKIFLTGNTPMPPNKKIRKTSRSTEQYVEYEYFKSPFTAIEQLKTQGYSVVALEITSTSIPLNDLPGLESVCLILGSENLGIEQSLLDLAEYTCHIPMHGNNSSMNVANACAIASYKIIENM